MAGVIGVLAAQKNRRGLIVAYMVLNIILCCAMLVFTSLSVIAIRMSSDAVSYTMVVSFVLSRIVSTYYPRKVEYSRFRGWPKGAVTHSKKENAQKIAKNLACEEVHPVKLKSKNSATNLTNHSAQPKLVITEPLGL